MSLPPRAKSSAGFGTRMGYGSSTLGSISHRCGGPGIRLLRSRCRSSGGIGCGSEPERPAPGGQDQADDDEGVQQVRIGARASAGAVWSCWDGRPPVGASRGENESQDAAHRETCDMRPDIRALAAEAKKHKQHDSGRERRPPTNPAAPRDDAGAPHVTRKDPQRAKDASRGADRRVFRRLNQRDERIPEGFGQENGQPRET
jgi:hypothetical protein